MEELLQSYGYWALLAVTMMEGETIVLIAGFLAQRGYLDLHLVMLTAFAGSFTGDQIYYYVGRHWGSRLLARFPSWRRPVETASGFLRRYDIAFILGFRWIWGVRSFSPFAIGIAGVPPLKYLVWNFIAAALWAVTFPLLGFYFGKAIEAFLADVKSVELYLIGIALAGLLGFWGWRQLRRR
ncbi:MAG: DedA family protein [Thalassobaculales bacterium]